MKANKHLLLWSSLGVLTLLAIAAIQENFLRDWRQIQAAVRSETGPIDVRLRQTVVPALKVSDRCVTCHLGMAAGEQGLTGGPVTNPHKLVGHDPAEYGCTVCHGGQGSATEKADAHGHVEFWPEPMIPARYAYAGCGNCHTHLRVPDHTQLAEGRGLLERLDCLACHRSDGRGGTLRPAGGGMEGPDLSRVGLAGYDRQWYEGHHTKWKDARKGPWKDSFGEISQHDQRVLELFLASRVGAPGLVEAKSLFHSLGCRGCHKVGGVGGDDGPDLTREGQKDPGRLDFSHVPGEPTLVNWLAEHFRRPAHVVPGSQMPAFDLSEPQIDGLVMYMLALRRSDVPEAFWPKDRIQTDRFGQREFATDGKTLFGTFCAACHGSHGEGRRYPGIMPFPSVANPDFLAAASDDFLMATVKHGRPGRRMPAWGAKEGGLRPEEVTNVVAYLREMGGVPKRDALRSDARWITADPARGKALFATYCAGCHGAKGEGNEGPALANPGLKLADDSYFVDLIGRGRRGTPMPGFRQPSTTHPVLAGDEIESVVAHLRTLQESHP